MASFFVGMRVKKARGEINVGETGVVESVVPFFLVSPDRDVMSRLGYLVTSGTPWRTNPDHWEPVLPSGHQPAELTVEELLPFLKTREVSDVAL